MISANPICPISTRPAYFGTRRIAPVAATSRSKAWGARPADEELRPARSKSKGAPSTQISPLVRPAAPFIAHVIGQMSARDADALHAAKGYAAADALNYEDLSISVASL